MDQQEMKSYVGVKDVYATPMTLGDYNAYRGWNMPDDEDPNKQGYLVEYKDGGEPNHPNHNGYISWSPADVFEKSYQPTIGLTFGFALEALKAGKKVARAGWNGKGMFLFLVQGSTFKVNRKPLLGIYPEGTEINYRPHIDMKDAEGKIVPWLASQTDLLADDWQVVE